MTGFGRAELERNAAQAESAEFQSDRAAALTELAWWRILAIDVGRCPGFLSAWHAWKHDPKQPRTLHYVAIAASPCDRDELIQAAANQPQLLPLAHELAAQWFGLTRGAHRLSFEDGRVLLTLHVREPVDVLRAEPFTVDEVQLDGNIGAEAIKAVARHCRRGTRISAAAASDAVQRALHAAGFVLDTNGDAAGAHLAGVFDPAWQPRGLRSSAQFDPRDALVIGGGLAGAAAAASLARRGWSVTVLDAAREPAGGASGLPVGLLAPHYSPDDNLLSRLSRAGVRMTMREARRLLREGEDWSPRGALELRMGEVGLPPVASDAYRTWGDAAPAIKKSEALLDSSECALWHEQAAWIKPSALIRSWLADGRIAWNGGAHVSAIEKDGDAWTARGADGEVLARASVVVVASALASAVLLRARIVLQPVRGQISWTEQPEDLRAPDFPVNGNGHFIPAVPYGGGRAWFSGSSYGRGDADNKVREADQHANQERLRSLLPAVAAQLEGAFSAGQVHAWSGVRCTSADRRPLVGEVEPGLWLSAAMGSRGLTFCALAAEIIAARLHDEPLPIEHKLAQSLDVSRAIVQPGTQSAT